MNLVHKRFRTKLVKDPASGMYFEPSLADIDAIPCLHNYEECAKRVEGCVNVIYDAQNKRLIPYNTEVTMVFSLRLLFCIARFAKCCD